MQDNTSVRQILARSRAFKIATRYSLPATRYSLPVTRYQLLATAATPLIHNPPQCYQKTDISIFSES
jgi:hypothetical protein